jgi:hypothetical protein
MLNPAGQLSQALRQTLQQGREQRHVVRRFGDELTVTLPESRSVTRCCLHSVHPFDEPLRKLPVQRRLLDGLADVREDLM